MTRNDREQFFDDAEILDIDMHQLVLDHPNQWAAMYKGEITIDQTLEGLFEKLEGEENASVRHLDPNAESFFLTASEIEMVH